MTPAPNLQELIDSVRIDEPGDDPLAQLAQASRTVADLEDVADALLGHFVDRCRRSGRSWSEISTALGVSKQAAHKRFALPAPTASSPPTFERFTPRARAVLKHATDEARARGDDSVRTEHLLLALFEPAEALAAQVLAEAGITKAACQAWLPPGPQAGGRPAAAATPYSSVAIEALRAAVEEALRLGHNYIGTEHLMLALFRDPDDLAARALAALGAGQDDTRSRLSAKLAALTKP